MKAFITAALLFLVAAMPAAALSPYGATIHTASGSESFVTGVYNPYMTTYWDRDDIYSATVSSTRTTWGSVPGCSFDLEVFYTTTVVNCELLNLAGDISGSVENSFSGMSFDFHYNEVSETPYEFTVGGVTVKSYLGEIVTMPSGTAYKFKVYNREGARVRVNVFYPPHNVWYRLRMLLDDGTRSVSQSTAGTNPLTTCGSVDIDKELIQWDHKLPRAKLYWTVLGRDPATSPSYNTSAVPENGIAINVYDASAYDYWGSSQGAPYFTTDTSFVDPEVPRVNYADMPVTRHRVYMNRTTTSSGTYVLDYSTIRTIRDGVIVDTRYRPGMVYHMNIRMSMRDEDGRPIPFEGYVYRCSYPFASPHWLGPLDTMASGPGGELDTTVSFTVSSDMAANYASGDGRCSSFSFKFTSISLDGRTIREPALNQMGSLTVSTVYGYAVPV